MAKANKLLWTSKLFSALKKGKVREGEVLKQVNRRLTGASDPGYRRLCLPSASRRNKKLTPFTWQITRVFRHAESPPTGRVSEFPLGLLGSLGNKSSIIQKSSWRDKALVFPSEHVPCSQKDKMSSTPQGQKANFAEPLGPCSKELTASNKYTCAICWKQLQLRLIQTEAVQGQPWSSFTWNSDKQ